MIHFQNIRKSKRDLFLLFISVALLLLKGLEYLFIGIVYPLSIGLLLLCPLIYGWLKGGKKFQKTVKYWSVLVICYGLIRILLHVFVSVHDSGVPSGAYYQFTIWYGLKSSLYIILGGYLLTKRKSIRFQRNYDNSNIGDNTMKKTQ